MRQAWLIVALMLILPAVAQARGGGPGMGAKGGPGLHEGGFGMGPGGPMGAWWRDPELQKKLALTDDQVKKLQGALQERRSKLVDLRGDLEKREMELQDLMDADPPDAAKIQAATDQVIAARGRLQKDFMGMMLLVRTTLTKEQWVQLRELRHHDGRGRGPGPQGPDEPPPPPPPGE